MIEVFQRKIGFNQGLLGDIFDVLVVPQNPADYRENPVLVPSHHELGTKLLLDNVMLPAAQGNAANSTTAV